MKKAILFFLVLCQLKQRAFAQNSTMQLNMRFTSVIKNRVALHAIYNYKINAVDNSGKEIKIEIKNVPYWLHWNPATNVLSGKAANAGQYYVDAVAAAKDTVIHQQFMLTVYDAGTKNILTLGNSITNGTNKYNSYRRALWQMLHNDNYNIDFIGSWSKHHNGGNVPDPDFDMDHDGHSGWKASDILQPPDWDKQGGNLYKWLQHYKPDIVLMELGTNEVFQCVPVSEAMNNLNTIIQLLRKKNPAVKIFLAQIPPLGAAWANKKLCNDSVDYAQAVIEFNKSLALLAAKKNSSHSPVILVDQFTGIDTSADLYDDIHPNDKGEGKMAERWFEAVKKYLSKLK